jgi:hypothetical protein
MKVVNGAVVTSALPKGANLDFALLLEFTDLPCGREAIT